MLTSHISEQEVTDSLLAGANAYVMKDINIEVLKMIIKTVKDSAMWLDPQVVPILRDKNCAKFLSFYYKKAIIIRNMIYNNGIEI